MRPTFVIVCLFALVGVSLAEDADLIKVELGEAKKKFADQGTIYRKAITAHLDEQEKKARENGDKKLVDQIKSERKSLEDTKKLPTLLPAFPRAEMIVASDRLEAAYQRAIREYTKISKDDDATAVENEFEIFKKSDEFGVLNEQSTLLPVGAVIVGKIHIWKIRPYATNQMQSDWKMTIVESGATKGRGHLTWSGDDEVLKVEIFPKPDGKTKFMFHTVRQIGRLTTAMNNHGIIATFAADGTMTGKIDGFEYMGNATGVVTKK